MIRGELKMAKSEESMSLQTRLPAGTALTFKEVAKTRGLSEAQLLREVVEAYIDELDIDAMAQEIKQQADLQIARLRGRKTQ